MKKCITIFSIVLVLSLMAQVVDAQCAMCTKTAMQMGEKPAQGLNSGILYLMITPFAIVGFIAYRWWKNNKQVEDDEALAKGSA